MYEVIDEKGIAYIDKGGEFKKKPKGDKIRKSDIESGFFTEGGLERLAKDKRVKKLKESAAEKKAREEAEAKAKAEAEAKANEEGDEPIDEDPPKINAMTSDGSGNPKK